MTLRAKLIAIILSVALVPLVISASSTLNLHHRGFEAKTADLHQKSAQFASAFAERSIEDLVRTLRATGEAIHWPALNPEERAGALWLIYREFDDAAVTSLLDEEGAGIGTSVYVTDGEQVEEVAKHPTVSLELLNEYAAHIPLEEARRTGAAFGPTFRLEGSARPFLPVAVRVGGPEGRPWFVALAYSLESLCRQLAQMAPQDVRVHLFDSAGRAVCDDAPTHLSAAAIASLHAGQVLTVPSSHGEDMLVARIAATNGWAAVTEQPRAKAFAYSRGIQTQALAWIAVSGMLALVAGLFLAENINHPVQALVDGANRLARGEFGHRIEVTRAGELGRLSHAFNLMGAEIERRDAEIRAWSQELQRRVEERTAELREAQVQLIRSQRISAVSGLGAGMAHEINNPLAGVLGLAQILSKKLQNRTELANELRLIRILEGEALRIRDVVCTLRSLTESYGNKEFSIVDVHGVLDSALEPFEGQLQADGVVVQREFAHPMPPVRGNAEQLRQVFINLFQNARTAMKGRPGQLRVATSVLEGAAVKVAVSDSGKGIEIEHLEKIFDPFFTTKDDWAGEGLGLTIAHRVVEQHEGQIKATSVPGQGTTMTITLPAAVRGTMLI